MSDSNSIGDGMALFRQQQSPPLDLKAVEARLADLLSQPDGVLSALHETNEKAAALLALLQETRTVLTDLLPIADSVPPIAARIRAVLAKATKGQP